MKLKIHIFRHFRGRWFAWEWHNYNGTRYFMVSVSSPNYHARWARSVYIYF